MKVEFYRHNVTDEDIESVSEVLHSIFLTTGPVTAEFERKFSLYVGLEHTVALSSCTTALHLSLLALGIGPGDEVITTPMTFIASATAIMQAGASPVFVDVEEKTGLIDVSKVEKAITPRTKAILPVHLYGAMVDMRALREIADRHHLKIVEDAAHCVEGERDGVRPGHLGHVACYSFYATKSLTCGEGGAIGTKDGELARTVRCLSLHGMNKDAASRYTDRYRHWDMVLMGWKGNLDDVHSALMVRQIDRVDEYWRIREEIAGRYDEAFRHVPGVRLPEKRGKSGRHLYTVWVDPAHRDRVLHGLQERGIGVAVNYRALHGLHYFRETFRFQPDDYPIAYAIGESTLSLPFYPRLKRAETAYVISSLKEVLETL
jgi:dTDP-4-amino-4,6-dideoxygalactose transaminase